jgi:LysM repeat protein
MAGRSPARFLAPLALVAFVVVLLMILQAGGDEQSGEEPATNSNKPAATSTPTPKAKRKRKVYVVKPGDTPSGIAEKTGVSLEQLEVANPDLDPQLLAPGQRIKLPR